MKKFTQILESVSTSKFFITKDQWNLYKRLIQDILSGKNGFYKETTVAGMKFAETQPWENPNRLKSILNYANTNQSLLTWFVNKPEVSDFNTLVDYITTNKVELFTKEGSMFNEMLNILINTESIGVKNEEFAKGFLTKYLKDMNRSFDIIRTDTDCYADLILGVDIYFTVDNKPRKYTVQVKPLNGLKQVDDLYYVKSGGMIKKYDIDYYIFVNFNKNKAMLFRGNDLSSIDYKEKEFIFPIKSLVHTK